MDVSIIGGGRAGLVRAAAFAQRGHRVLHVDTDAGKIDGLRAGRPPFYEPGLDLLLESARRAERLEFGTSREAAAAFGEIVFAPDVDTVTEALAASPREVLLVPEAAGGERPGGKVELALNPAFLREGAAVEDALRPDRIVLGVSGPRGETLLRRLYAPFDAPILVTDFRSAELIHHASNAFLALKISYINAVATICERAGASVTDVARGMGLDARIGPHFLRAGIGYGGACFPNDVPAFRALAAKLGVDFRLLEEVERLNRDARERFVERAREALGGLKGRTVAALGLTYKPNTDDVRCSAGVAVARRLGELGASLRIYDPRANGELRSLLPGATACPTPYEAARGADVALLLTEWEEFRRLDLDRLRSLMARPLLLDGRNVLEPERVRAKGFTYQSVGRP